MQSGIIQVEPIIDPKVIALCRRPYPNHQHGCPNWGKKVGCPPQAPLFDQYFDCSQPIYALVNVFSDYQAHCQRMREAHPEWSQRQVECCLYWQGRARKQLEGLIKEFEDRYAGQGYVITRSPEAMGANVTATLAMAGITLEWPPKDYTVQVAMAGKPR